jgi:hypothetical protein
LDQVAELVERCRAEDDGGTQVDLVVELEDHVADPRVLDLFVSTIADADAYDLTPGAEDDVDLRHNALSSVREAGPGERTVTLLRRLTEDPDLGAAATRTLREWA